MSASSRWYAFHGRDHNRKRKSRYETDEAYRERVKAAVLRNKKKKAPPVPMGHRWTFAGAAQRVGVSLFTIKNWKARELYPEPAKFNGRFYFTEHQVTLLQQLREFFVLHRRVRKHDPALLDLVGLIYANWS